MHARKYKCIDTKWNNLGWTSCFSAKVYGIPISACVMCMIYIMCIMHTGFCNICICKIYKMHAIYATFIKSISYNAWPVQCVYFETDVKTPFYRTLIHIEIFSFYNLKFNRNFNIHNVLYILYIAEIHGASCFSYNAEIHTVLHISYLMLKSIQCFYSMLTPHATWTKRDNPLKQDLLQVRHFHWRYYLHVAHLCTAGTFPYNHLA